MSWLLARLVAWRGMGIERWRAGAQKALTRIKCEGNYLMFVC